MEILVSYAALLGMDKKGVEEIFKVKTTEAAMPIIEKYGLVEKGFYDLLAKRASLRSEQHVFIIFSMKIISYQQFCL